MLLVLAYWLFLFFVTSSAGILFCRFARWPNLHPSIIILIGCAGITLFASLWSIFSGLSTLFECLVVALLVFSTWINKNAYQAFIKDFWYRLISFPLLLKILSAAILIIAAAKCASAPYLIDNESYYIQSIKWLDSFGFVKGLGNLHLFLNQNSGWHILQSAVNLDFLFEHFNDLSGFILLVANFYGLDHLNKYLKYKEKVYLVAGFFPIFNILLFQFISAPSPDIAVYVCFFIVVTEFLKRVSNVKSTSTSVLFFIGVFAVYIKVICLPLLVFPLYLWYLDKSFTKKTFIRISTISGVFLILFVIKNTIISGYPLYPIDLLSFYEPEWKIPKILQEYIVRSTNNYAYFLTEEEIKALSKWELFLHWLNLPKLHGLFNKLCILLVITLPLLFIKSKNKRGLLLFYIAFIIQLSLLFISSPQYRFFLMFIILGICVLLAKLFEERKIILTCISLSIGVIAIPLFFSLNLNKLTQNKLHFQSNRFQFKNSIVPHVKTQYTSINYQKKTIQNLTYYTPDNLDFFWGIGDGPLPSVQEIQVNFLKDNYHILPQQRTKNISDGFYSLLLTNNE